MKAAELNEVHRDPQSFRLAFVPTPARVVCGPDEQSSLHTVIAYHLPGDR